MPTTSAKPLPKRHQIIKPREKPSEIELLFTLSDALGPRLIENLTLEDPTWNEEEVISDETID